MTQVSKQLRILHLLREHLEGVCPDNGDDFDLTGRVSYGRLVLGAESKPPFVTIVEALPEDLGQPADQYSAVRTREWLVRVQGWAETGAKQVDNLYEMMATVQRRLALLTDKTHASFMFGRLLSAVKVYHGMVVPSDSREGREAYFFLPVGLHYVAEFRNPFTTVEE
jgi:hypothetical protein